MFLVIFIQMRIALFILIISFINQEKIVKNTLDKDFAEIYKDSLFILKTEVTNIEYLNFVEYIKTKQSKITIDSVMPNSNLWIDIKNKQKAYEDYYFKHPAYKNYPVVNITKRQAELFCEWKTYILNKKLLNLDSYKLIVRLPTKEEWKHSALGGLPSYNKYPWKELSMRGKDGSFRCNFKYTKGKIKTKKGYINSLEDLTAPVESFYPNGWGIYNVSGNVSELIKDDTIAMGGNWDSFDEDVSVNSYICANKASPKIGFRYIVEIVYKDN